MLDCESGFHQSEDKRRLNCHKLRSSYVTSILITKLTFAMFFSQTEYIIRCYFSLCFISFVSFMRKVNRSFSLLFFFFSICYQTLISDIDKFILALFIVR